MQLNIALTHSLAAEDATVVIFAFAFDVDVVVAGVAVAALGVVAMMKQLPSATLFR